MLRMRDPLDYLRPIWLSHHTTEQADRCTIIGGRHVCRRCLWLWPLTFAVMAVSMTVGLWPESYDDVLLTLLPLPAVVEFLGDVRGRFEYSARRQMLTAIPLAAALGRGFARYLEDPGDELFWNMALVYGGLCAAVALLPRVPDRS
jgi:hypothetical protein